MLNPRYIFVLLLVFLSGISLFSYSQEGIMRRLPRPGMGGGMTGGGGRDSLMHRDAYADSITINFRFLDSSRLRKFDSSITDYSTKFPVPWHYIHLGNVGNAARSLIFTPMMKPGWDNGFHAFDIYTFKDHETRFYNTTRPFSQLNYQLGSRLEQIIELMQTQNILPNWNAAFQYRLINAPGFFQNQNTNHNNYRFNSWYQSKNKRYQNFLVVIGNKLESAENGGIRGDGNYLDSVEFNLRLSIPTQLGVNSAGRGGFFSGGFTTGSRYTTASYLMRQQYDLGQKDSIVTDSSVIPLFYPRLRMEHTINYRTYNYRFTDEAPDSLYYDNHYGIVDPSRIFRQDYWKELLNDFSLYQFPDAKNPQQFFKAGATLQTLNGSFDSGRVKQNYHNVMLHGEYRNKTRNQKWDINAYGNFYLNGFNAGDYNAFVSLRSLISRNIGYLELGFENVNRTPSFIYNTLSGFYLGSPVDFNKENNTQLFGVIDLPRQKLKLSGRYYLITNYSYFKDFKQPEQYAPLFNLLQLSAEKQFRIGGNWNWRTWVVLQQKTGNAPVNLPLLFTRNQVGYDGNLGFKNLLISFGLEFRYFTPYKADDYSPLMGQFINQQTQTFRMNFPELAAYIHFRIKGFTAYIRSENLNTLDLSTWKFTNNQLVAPNYPYPGMQIRVGIYWSFVN
ncbi:MAG TPA: hypothetical protein PK339_07610 [Flavitalea sp.]|nr:hypothetical protein [Flavitalea sp.]